MKRFTATEKWADPWFRKLPPTHKLAWAYLCDNCDAAGVIDLDREMADFKIGENVDWQSFFKAAGKRCEQLESGKVWLTGFIEFQYGRISEDCKAHKPVFASIEKHSLNKRVSKGYPKDLDTLKEKEKDTDKDKDKEGGAGETKRRAPRFTPPTVDEVREFCLAHGHAVDAVKFVNFYTSKGWKVGNQAMKDWRAAVRTWESNANSRGSPSQAVRQPAFTDADLLGDSS